MCAAALVCASCGGGYTPTASDREFLDQVHSNAPDISSYRSDVALTRLGHAACDGFSSGVSYQQLADRLVLAEGSHPLPTADLGAVITAAVNAYCPRYASQVQ